MKKKRWLHLMLLLAVLLFALPIQASAASIRLNKTSLSLTVGKKQKLTAAVTGKSKKVTWKSSNTSVATVSKTGVVTAKKSGKVTITAKANGKTAKCVAAVKNESYRTLYKKFLAKSRVKAGKNTIKPGHFYILNIDKKGNPELVVTAKDVGPHVVYFVYTAKDGKVKYMGSCTIMGMSNNPVLKYSSKYKGIYVGGWINGVGGSFSALYGVSGTKLVRKQHGSEYHYPKDEYFIGTTDRQNQKVSKSKCAAFCKSYFSTLKEYKMKANTAANRKKI